jgi:hypothetical protein
VMVMIVSRYCTMLLLLLPVLQVCCLGRTSRGLWDQLPVKDDSYIRTNVKKRTLAVNNIDKIKILEGDKGFWGKILKMGMKKTKTKKMINKVKEHFQDIPKALSKF